MMSEVAVFITSAGRRVGLCNCFRQSGDRLGHRVRIIAGDLSPELSAACALADLSLRLPRATESGYADAVAQICSREGVALVVPTIDTELLPLSLARDAIARSGARVNVAAPDVIRIARDKLQTATILAAAGLATPASLLPGENVLGSGGLTFPLIAKPRDGSSSEGVRTINSQQDLDVLREHDGYVVQECLRGIEFTVNIFVDQQGLLRASVPHRRMEVRNGEVAKGRTERNVALTEMAEQLVGALPGIQGVLCFQAFLTERGPVIFEINARFGGGYPLTHASGATFTQWLLEEALRLPLTATDDWKSGVQMLRYDSEVFV